MTLKKILLFAAFISSFSLTAQKKLVSDLKINVGLATNAVRGSYKNTPTFALTDYIHLKQKGSSVLLSLGYSGVFKPNNLSGVSFSAITARTGYRQVLPVNLYAQGEFGLGFFKRSDDIKYNSFSYAFGIGYLLKMKANAIDVGVSFVGNRGFKKFRITNNWINIYVGYQIRL